MRDLELLLVGLLIASTARRIDRYTVGWRVDPKVWGGWWSGTVEARWVHTSLDEYEDLASS